MRLGTVPLVAKDTRPDHTDWRHPDNVMDRDLLEYLRLVGDAVEAARMSDRERANLRVGLGLNNRQIPDGFPMCNSHVRLQAYRSLYDAVRPHWRASTGTKRRWFFLTFFTDCGNALEYDTVVEFARTRRNLNRMLADTGLDAVGMLEVQAGTNFPGGGNGCSVMLHGHYIGYTDDPDFDEHRVAAQLCRRTVLSNWLGAPTASIVPVTQLGELFDRCRYINKPPLAGKYLVPDHRQATGFFVTKADVMRPVLLRLAEVLGHFEFSDFVSGTGTAGLAMKRDWRRSMQAWHRRQRNVVDVDVPALIQQVWQTDRTRVTRPPIDVRRDVRSPPSTAWHDAMASRIEEVEANRANVAARSAGRRRTHTISVEDEL